MEFTIEEMRVEKSCRGSLFQRCRNHLDKIFQGFLFIGFRWKEYVVLSLNRLKLLTVKQELGVAALIFSILFSGILGKDFWQVSKERRQSDLLQKTLLQQIVERGRLGQQALPVMAVLQQQWLKENAGNIRQLLLLLPDFSQSFKDEMTFTAFRKEERDPHFYLEGNSAQYDAIFRLEKFFIEHQWESLLMLDTDSTQSSELKFFQLKLLPKRVSQQVPKNENAVVSVIGIWGNSSLNRAITS